MGGLTFFRTLQQAARPFGGAPGAALARSPCSVALPAALLSNLPGPHAPSFPAGLLPAAPHGPHSPGTSLPAQPAPPFRAGWQEVAGRGGWEAEARTGSAGGEGPGPAPRLPAPPVLAAARGSGGSAGSGAQPHAGSSSGLAEFCSLLSRAAFKDLEGQILRQGTARGVVPCPGAQIPSTVVQSYHHHPFLGGGGQGALLSS